MIVAFALRAEQRRGWAGVCQTTSLKLAHVVVFSTQAALGLPFAVELRRAPAPVARRVRGFFCGPVLRLCDLGHVNDYVLLLGESESMLGDTEGRDGELDTSLCSASGAEKRVRKRFPHASTADAQ